MFLQLEKPGKGDTIAVIKMNLGSVKIKLFPQVAPKAVENFITHAKNGYYDRVIFHRVIPGFMIQSGDPTGTGRGGTSIFGHNFKDEFDVNYRNIRGALSMANAGPNTNGSQFFIVQNNKVENRIIQQMRTAGENSGYSDDIIAAYEQNGGAFWLDFKHTVFGQVFEGMEVVDQIAESPTDQMDKPLSDVVIENIVIIRKS